MRLIDADALIKDISDSVRYADEWEKESNEKQDAQGMKCAIETRGALLAMILRLKEAPTIDAVPVRHAHWVFRDEDKHLLEDGCIPCNMWCSYCEQWSDNDSYGDAYCHNCGSRMDETDLADEIAKEMNEDEGTD